VAVRALEFGVDVDEPLNEVVARRQIAKARNGRSEIGVVNRGGLTRRELVDVATEERNAGAADLQPRLGSLVAGDHHVNASRDGPGVRGRWERDFEPRPR
jgi:hypothetical protein